jgi:Tfp pilus assembly protein PilX
MLGITIIEGSLLQNRMSNNFKQKMFAFQQAEVALQLAEKSINKNNFSPKITKQYSFVISTEPNCKYKQCFLITAVGQYHNAKTILHSCYTDEVEKKFRSCWWEEG